MGFFDRYPYTNWHNVNLDWVLERVKEWGEMVEANDRAFKDLQEANEAFKQYVTEYLQNLDIQSQIDDKLDRMFESGELTEYLQPYVSNTVTTWLNENITEPEGVVIDSSLTVAGAAADAKATGDKITEINESIDGINNTLYGDGAEERSEIFTDVGREGPGLYIDYTNGAKTTFSVTWSYITDFIPIIGGSVIEVSGVNTNNNQDRRGFALYNESKQYLNGVQYVHDITSYSLNARNDARYIRITYDGISENPKIYMTVDSEEGGIVRQLNDLKEKIEIDPTNPFSKIVSSIGLIEIFETVGCIGDSIASGECTSSNHGNIDLYQFSWGQYLSRMTNNTYYNFSAGGVTAKSWHTNANCGPICFDGNHICKMYIIGLGQNDANIIRNQSSASQSAYIGTTEDINLSNYNANADTFYGNYGKIIQRIKEVQSKAKIFILTDPANYVEETGINTAIRNIANLFTNVYLLDLYRFKDGVYNSEIITNTRRGGHYNAIGYHEMALYLATYIDWYIRNNLSEFNQVEFIGTDYVYNG